jgi:ATP adenylyltransferase
MPTSPLPPSADNAAPLLPASLQAPWRLSYLETMPTSPTSPTGSFLLDYWNAPHADAQHHVIRRTDAGLILLNRYPYANGHLLVALGDPRPTLLDYDPSQRAIFWQLVDAAADLMQRALTPQGINIGVNQGRAAGAGVPQHLHAHLVPRWAGDVNFMNTVAGVRVNPASLEAMWQRYMTMEIRGA